MKLYVKAELNQQINIKPKLKRVLARCIYVMVDFICMGLVELGGRQASENYKLKKILPTVGFDPPIKIQRNKINHKTHRANTLFQLGFNINRFTLIWELK